MGRFSRLLQAKGKDIEIDGKLFNIKPLPSKHIGLFMDSKGKEDAKTFELVLLSLQQTEPELVLEDVYELPMGLLTQIMDVIVEVNELNEK